MLLTEMEMWPLIHILYMVFKKSKSLMNGSRMWEKQELLLLSVVHLLEWVNMVQDGLEITSHRQNSWSYLLQVLCKWACLAFHFQGLTFVASWKTLMKLFVQNGILLVPFILSQEITMEVKLLKSHISGVRKLKDTWEMPLDSSIHWSDIIIQAWLILVCPVKALSISLCSSNSQKIRKLLRISTTMWCLDLPSSLALTLNR